MAGGRVTGSGLSGTSPSTGGRALIILIVLSISLFTASVRGGETGVPVNVSPTALENVVVGCAKVLEANALSGGFVQSTGQ